MADIRETVLLDHMDTGRFRKRTSSALGFRIKTAVRSFVVATADTPLRHLYHAIYRAHVSHAVRVLKKLPGIHSIYSTGGMAIDEIHPGISDIDLTVNGIWTEAEQARLIAVLKRLSEQSPLYDSLLSQCTQSLDALQSLYATDFYFQYLFDRGRTRWKLLYGEDIFCHLPQAPETRVGGGYYMELRTWWSYFIKSVFGFGPTATGEIFRKSIPYKAVAGTLMCKAYFNGEPPVKSRRAIMQQSAERASGADRNLLERLIASANSHHRHFDGDIQQETYPYLMRQLEAVHAELGRNPSFHRMEPQHVRDAGIDISINSSIEGSAISIEGSATEMMVSPPAREYIDAVVAHAKTEWKGYRSAYLVPCLSFFYPDDLVLLLEVRANTLPDALPTVQQVRDLCRYALDHAGALKQRVALYLLLPEAAYQLEIVSVIEQWHHTLCPQANPEVFAFLERPEFVIDGQPRSRSQPPLWSRFASALVDEEIATRRAAFSKAVQGAEFSSIELLRNLWRHLQLEIVQRSTQRGSAVLPMTLPAIQRTLQQTLRHVGLPAATLLDELREAYVAELNGQPADVRPLLPQLMALFATFAPDSTTQG